MEYLFNSCDVHAYEQEPDSYQILLVQFLPLESQILIKTIIILKLIWWWLINNFTILSLNFVFDVWCFRTIFNIYVPNRNIFIFSPIKVIHFRSEMTILLRQIKIHIIIIIDIICIIYLWGGGDLPRDQNSESHFNT